MVDAFTGSLLWRAGPDASANLKLPEMTASIPSDLTALELTNDGFVDLLYFGDLKGRIWRLDFNKAAETANGLVTGGVFADLGGTGIDGARRFFTAPDVSYAQKNGASWFNVAIGSGNRELPITDSYLKMKSASNVTDDRFYSLRDRNKLVPYDWSLVTPIKETDLADVTDTKLACPTGMFTCTDAEKIRVPVNPPDANGPGWLMKLNTKVNLDLEKKAISPAQLAGEKVLSPSRTFDNTIFFSTFVPILRSDNTDAATDPTGTCTDAVGYNYLYEVSLFDASESKYLKATAHKIVAEGRAIQLEQYGIAPGIVFLFPGADGDEPNEGTRPPPVCLVGVEGCGSFNAFEPKRTYWRNKGAE
jgi:type IV pilus assembly protein PilY1